MKILRLQSENVKRLTAVDITPDGTLVIVGGRNGAGKSSVLDSIAYALGGSSLVPAEPIRAGEAEAKIVVELDDYIITRKFRREQIVTHADAFTVNQKLVDHVCIDSCTTSFGPTNSSLIVTNKEGARFPTPQALLDKLLGKLTFDPLEFATMGSKTQRETLRAIAGLDFSDLDMEKLATTNERTLVNREVKALMVQRDALGPMMEAPDAMVDIAALSAELENANASLERSRAAVRTYEIAVGRLTTAKLAIKEAQDEVERVREQLRRTEQVVTDKITAYNTMEATAADIEKAAKDITAAAIDPAPIRDAIKSADTINTKVRDNLLRAQTRDALASKTRQSEALSATLDDNQRKRLERLAAAQFPIPGISLTDDGVTYNGVPLEQASSSERLRLSVAVGLALNPKLQVLLVRNGNQLDEDSLKALGEQAAEANAQVWLEWVTKDAAGMSVMIEDGHIA